MPHPVRLVTIAPTPTAVVAAETTWSDFPALWRALLAEVWAFLRGSGLSTGRNVMLYEDDTPRVQVGAEVGGPFAASGRVVASSLPAGRAATTVLRGQPTPEGLAAAHAAVRRWCAANGHELSGVRWEVYGHWREDQDPALFETEVYWQLRPDAVAPTDAPA
jgi:effector-binding domain-containing protein